MNYETLSNEALKSDLEKINKILKARKVIKKPKPVYSTVRISQEDRIYLKLKYGTIQNGIDKALQRFQ